MPMSSQQFSIHIPFRLFVDTQWIKGLTAKPDDLGSTTPNPQSRNQEPTSRSLISQTCTHKHIGNVKMKETDNNKNGLDFLSHCGLFFNKNHFQGKLCNLNIIHMFTVPSGTLISKL